MRRLPLVLALPLLIAFTTGCATTGATGSGPAVGSIRPAKSTAAFLENLSGELAAVGFETEVRGEALMAEHADSYKYIIGYDDTAGRLIHYAFFGIQEGLTCASPNLIEAIALSNRDYNLGKIYCDTSDNTIGYEGVLLVPQAGFTAHELRDYLIFLSDKLVVMSNKTGLFELLQ